MAKEDFCFTYYDGDAARDMAHMNRLERGGYGDIIISQRKFGRLSLDRIKKILGRDFTEIWDSIELVLDKDQEGNYFIVWLENSILKMKHGAKKNQDRIREYWNNQNGNTKPIPNEDLEEPKVELEEPLENGNGNGNGNEDVYEDGDFGKSENLLPKMLTVWKEKNHNYPADSEDLQILNSFAKFICKQEGISYQPREPDVIRLILTNWEVIAEWSADHKLYSNFQLSQIYNYRKSIITEIRNEQSNSKNGKAKPGAKTTDTDLNEALTKFRNKGKPASNSG